MKEILKIMVVVSLVLTGAFGCQDIPVGFLLVEDAGYNPDSLVVKRELDVTPPHLEEVDNPLYYELLEEYYTPEQLAGWGIFPKQVIEVGAGEDYLRDKSGMPWMSGPIEGVDGTAQVTVTIKEIQTTTGDAVKMRETLKVYGDGTFEVPVHHDLPTGRYRISLTFSNEGYSKDVNDCFTIIVK